SPISDGLGSESTPMRHTTLPWSRSLAIACGLCSTPVCVHTDANAETSRRSIADTSVEAPLSFIRFGRTTFAIVSRALAMLAGAYYQAGPAGIGTRGYSWGNARRG